MTDTSRFPEPGRAITIIMGQKSCDAEAAAKELQERADAAGLTLHEMAHEIIRLYAASADDS